MIMEGSCGLTRPGKISQPQSFIVSSSVSFQGLVLWITALGFCFFPEEVGVGIKPGIGGRTIDK